MLFALFYLSLLSTIFAADLPNIVILFVDGLGWGDIGANGRHTKDLKSVCVTLDGKHLITGSDDNTARLWSLEDGTMVREFKGHKGAVSSVCMTVDGKHLITGSWDKTARFWLLDVTEGTPE